MKKTLSTLLIVGIVSVAVALPVIIPQFAKHENRDVGVVAVYQANSGTNSVLNIDYIDGVPFRLHDVIAVTNGVEIPVTVSRVWVNAREVYQIEVTTNFFGKVETNEYWASRDVEQIATEIYDSATDTLPTPEYVLPNDAIQVNFGGVTGVTVRVVGTSQ